MASHRPSQLWSAGILALAAFSFPYVLFFTAVSKVFRRLFFKRPEPPPPPIRTAIVTGGKMTKALCVARQLKQSGCRVVLVETHKYWMVASRQASCVDRFVTVPVPEQDPEGYLKALKVLAYEEDADLFVPVSSPVASIYDARVKRVLPPSCRSLSTGEYWTQALDDKVTFSELAKMINLPVPDTVRITSKEELHAFNKKLQSQKSNSNPYILKNLAYDSMRRLDLFKLPCDPAALSAYVADVDITESTPWTCQEFIKGDEYSTCAVSHEGKLTMYTDNFASISCFNYKYQGDERLKSWVASFCEHYNISGVVCIDFIIDKEGTPRSIECNPRFSSNITNFYNRPDVGRAYLQPEECIKQSEIITPLPSAEETCWTATELYYALTKPGMSLLQRAHSVYEAFFVKKDAYWDFDDVMPFLALHYLHIPTLLYRNILRGNRWAKIDMCIGKLTEENGD